MKMKKYSKTICLLLITIFLCSLVTGCFPFKSKGKQYQSYVKNMMDANYKGNFKKFSKMTGSDTDTIASIYNTGMDALTDSLLAYYSISIPSDCDTYKDYHTLVETIYGKTKYDVSKAKKDEDGNYSVDVTIYPIDLLVTTNEDIQKYIDDFNKRKDNGDYDTYDKEQYELEFAQGIVNLLNSASENIGYLEPVTITVPIEETDDTYTISGDSFLDLDHALIANPDSTDSSESDSQTTSTTE